MSDSLEELRKKWIRQDIIVIGFIIPILAVSLVCVINPAIIPSGEFLVGICDNKTITVVDKYMVDDWFYVVDSNNTVYILEGSPREKPLRYKGYDINFTYQVTVCTFDTIMQE